MDSANPGQNGSGITIQEFHDLIAERKAERKTRAEKKRQSDMRRIEEMYSKTGIDPLHIFPKELWAEILSELISPMDKGNILKVHGMFHSLIPDSKRIRDVLFPLAIEEAAYDGSPLSSSFELLRGVSQSLRTEVNRQYEERLLNLIRTETMVTGEGVNLCDPKVIQKYFDGEEKLKYCPTRSICITMPTARTQVEILKANLAPTLKQMGGQIWCLRFCCDNESNLQGLKMTLSAIYEEFHYFLALMPNIKWLHLELLNFDESIPRRRLSKKTEFRKLQYLERIDCSMPWYPGTERAIQFFEAFLKTNCHIKTLCLKGDLASISRRVVQSLKLESFVPLITTSSLFGLIKDLVNYNWRLKRIHIQFKDYEKSFTISSVFSFLGKFPTLEYVNMNLAIDHRTLACELTYLRLPNLERFEMIVEPYNDTCFEFGESNSGARFFFSLQFLIYASKLKSLKWDDGSIDPRKIRECMGGGGNSERFIDFCGGLSDPCGSIIWDVFPQLETVDVILMREVEAGHFKSFLKEYRRRSLVSARLVPNHRRIGI